VALHCCVSPVRPLVSASSPCSLRSCSPAGNTVPQPDRPAGPVHPGQHEVPLLRSAPAGSHTHTATGKPANYIRDVTPIDPIVTAATVLGNPYTKEGVESLRILLYTSVNVHVVNGQRLKFNTVDHQSPENQCGQRSKRRKELVEVDLAVAAVTVESMGVTPPCTCTCRTSENLCSVEVYCVWYGLPLCIL